MHLLSAPIGRGCAGQAVLTLLLVHTLSRWLLASLTLPCPVVGCIQCGPLLAGQPQRSLIVVKVSVVGIADACCEQNLAVDARHLCAPRVCVQTACGIHVALRGHACCMACVLHVTTLVRNTHATALRVSCSWP